MQGRVARAWGDTRLATALAWVGPSGVRLVVGVLLAISALATDGLLALLIAGETAVRGHRRPYVDDGAPGILLCCPGCAAAHRQSRQTDDRRGRRSDRVRLPLPSTLAG
jgi:hypothetical protein